jgi:hypothetical protein
MAGFLLLPEDEVALVAHLVEVESLTRLAHDDLSFGPPVAGPLPAPLPLDHPDRFTFWVPQLGDLDGACVDYERAPILVWRRSRWHGSGALCPGRLSAQARARKDQPKALLRVHERVERWMKREGTKLHHPSAVFAFPQAARWVREGGMVWP